MNRHDVTFLQEFKGYPCVTITLPTHRSFPENKQDPVRVKNLVQEAGTRLLGEFSKREAQTVLQRLEALAEGIDYKHLQDGLVLCVSEDFSSAFKLPVTIPERVIIDEDFFTRDLVFALNRSPRYWVLVLSEQPTRLFEACRDDLSEIKDGGFPIVHEGPGGERPLPGGRGVNIGAYRDDQHRNFFRQVDEALAPFLKFDPLPLVVVGVDRYIAFYKEISAHKDAIMTTLTGSHDKTPAHEIGELVWPLVKANFAEERRQMLEELDNAIGERKYVSTIGEIWRAAHEGRGRILLVEEGFHYPARVDESGLNITAAEDSTAPDVIDDAVDEIIEEILDKGGRVVFMNDGELEAFGRMALILRY
ncbi:MAG TPA: hypothetical protein ENN07_06940 [candidate division Zixibacteria bacterium]|nr:hypothetical protein [candidate division Zixibacteria bacterium]